MAKRDKLFFNIYLKPQKDISTEEVEKVINLAIDWFRYNDNCYMVYTSSTVEQWMVRLRPLVKDGGKLFICELNIKNRNGWMIPDFWTWVKKPRS